MKLQVSENVFLFIIFHGDSFVFAEFPTNRTELEAVFDIFDRDGSGSLDYHEFVEALRPDRTVCISTIYDHVYKSCVENVCLPLKKDITYII